MGKKQQGHYCRMCGRYRANEKFSGKGHREHVCKDCHREQDAKKKLLKKVRQRAAEAGLRQPKRVDFTRTQAASYLQISPSAFDYWRKKLNIDPCGTYEGSQGTGFLYDIESLILISQSRSPESEEASEPEISDP
ncbi:MAG: hypothetical protein K8I82_28000, partial [Anaerolineae bacterium]|nr:hypothetical protein [Anaerolineae bacterium]